MLHGYGNIPLPDRIAMMRQALEIHNLPERTDITPAAADAFGRTLSDIRNLPEVSP
ncbi:MAG: hypothetical protein ACXVHB_06025 [Solirubrobacteraceae bacterium]